MCQPLPFWIKKMYDILYKENQDGGNRYEK